MTTETTTKPVEPGKLISTGGKVLTDGSKQKQKPPSRAQKRRENRAKQIKLKRWSDLQVQPAMQNGKQVGLLLIFTEPRCYVPLGLQEMMKVHALLGSNIQKMVAEQPLRIAKAMPNGG